MWIVIILLFTVWVASCCVVTASVRQLVRGNHRHVLSQPLDMHQVLAHGTIRQNVPVALVGCHLSRSSTGPSGCLSFFFLLKVRQLSFRLVDCVTALRLGL